MRIRVGRSFLAFASLWGLLGCGDASDAELSDSSSYPVRCDKNPNHSQCSNGVPAAPTTLTAAQTGTSQVTLTWVDNAVNETNYTIERKLTSASTFVQLASLGANVITYQDTTVAAGNSYDYRAKAINGVGSSGYSNTVTITLPASTARGPLASITCPVGAVPIPVGSTTASRQTLINANPNGTTFCLAAGVHTANGSNTPKTGNTFIGEFGAIIDEAITVAVEYQPGII